MSRYKSFHARALACSLLERRSARPGAARALELESATFLTATTGRRDSIGGKGKEPMHLGGNGAPDERLQGLSRLP
jgi:hypothetical protein